MTFKRASAIFNSIWLTIDVIIVYLFWTSETVSSFTILFGLFGWLVVFFIGTIALLVAHDEGLLK